MFSRLLAFIVSLATLAAAVLAFWPQLIGWQRVTPWAVLVADRGGVAAACILAVIVLLIIGIIGKPVRRVTAAIIPWLIVFIAATGWLLYDRGLGNPTLGKAQTGTGQITVMSWNTMGDSPAAEAIATMAEKNGAQVIALEETSLQTAQNVATILRNQGQPMQVFQRQTDDVYIAHSTALLVASALGDYTMREDAGDTSVSPTIIATPRSGSGPTVIAAHAVAPNALAMSAWRKDLRWLASQCVGANVVLLGDLNATVDNLEGLGPKALGECADAAMETKNGAVGTWPAWLPEQVGAPIDHVMFGRGWQVDGFTVVTTLNNIAGDHRPVIARLSPALAK